MKAVACAASVGVPRKKWREEMGRMNSAEPPHGGDDAERATTTPPVRSRDVRGYGPPSADDPTIVTSGVYPPAPQGAYVPLPAPQLPPVPMETETPRRGVSRRALLIGAGVGAVGVGAIGAGVGVLLSRSAATSGPATFGAGDAEQVAHLLRRAGFGLAAWDASAYLSAGVGGSIDKLLNYAGTPNSADALIASAHLDLTKRDDLVRSFMLRAIYSQHPLEEKMTLFWHGVLTSSTAKVGGSMNYPLLAQQGALIRTHAMGKLDDLIRAIATDPAMLIWLDGRLNTGKAPNENFSRELMELFTLGIMDSSGNAPYSQADVHQGALALSGWTLRANATEAVFMPTRHYAGPVNYLGHSGSMTVDDVVRIACAHPATGRHIAWRMWKFFAGELEGSTIPTVQGLNDPALTPLVNAYNTSGHSIAAMVKAMLTSPAFFGDAAYRSRVKSPIEFVAGALRGLGVEDYAAKNISGAMATLGQVPFAPPDVSGWDGDKVSGSWVSTQTWMSRCNLVNTLLAALAPARGSVASSPLQGIITTQQLATPTAVADHFISALVDNELPNDRRAILHDAVTAQASGPAFTLHVGGALPAASLRNTLYLLMAMPEYQMN
jgi:uncharacterized protein (DUF1800 family)